MSFSNLKKTSSFDRLVKEIDKLDKPTYEDPDAEKYWKPTPDKAGNALAVIRFLPTPEADGDDGLPWCRYWDHGFQSPITGKWYIERDLTSLDQKDPVTEYNTQLWNANQDDNSPERKQARDQKRRLHYVSNVYIVSDPKNPENNGKVKLFKYGKKIFDKITKMMNPDLETEKKINPFHFWEGADFKLKVTRQMVKIGNRSVPMPNYDEAIFLTPGPLKDDDKELEKIWKSEYSLKEVVDPKHYKSYDELKKRLDDVLGIGVGEVQRSERPQPRGTAVSDQPGAIGRGNRKPVEEDVDIAAPWVDEPEDDDLARFRALAEE
jgi:hypothetical protein